MDWLILVLAGFSEILGVTGINKVNQRISVMSILWLFGGFGLSFILLGIAMETIAMSTAYAVWTGMGTVGSAIVGMLFFKESSDWKRLLFIGMILSAAVGLKLIS
ncbi:QacE family quaternary ammonium compound efflux SMR transporter [Virgibacillus dokdonensis]|uniref:Multidrug resistance protein YkkD n=1 Tax=Virgibacillus dokdonensis TaxID=302167 RepID=A0A2K9IUY9_9BACI|nr:MULTISPECIES: multidrug efflux SMR transporter [Virgibacillus]AUJ23184.1 Multidrug resistance protein YkkD [Virgibacillus dokdonensis]RFA35549.1 QacE family quaternary ammonium compound efflux SMR transporter [Virgibacillus dokdonensis]